MSKWKTKAVKNPVPKNFCILPWVHVAANSSGTYRVCCQSDNEMNKIQTDEGSVAKLHRHNITDIWNAETYRNLRKQFLNNERPEMCHKCFREEAAGIVSARMHHNSEYSDAMVDSIVNTEDGNAPLNIKYVDLRLGNLCNLRCRMCNPYSSNQWVKEWHLVDRNLDSHEKAFLSNMKWFDTDFLWNNLSDIIDSVEEIYLTGGEPTLALKQYQLFDECIKRGVAKNITLRYNTNLTNIPDKMLEYWKNFKKIRLNCSIDGIGELNDYIRYPSKWKSIEYNWIRLHFLGSETELDLGVDVTVQMYNILYLDVLYDYFGNTLSDPIIPFYDPYLNILNSPYCFNVKVLPPKLKDEAARRLKPYETNHSKVPELLNYMYSEDWSDKFDDFITYTNALDESRNENILDYVPEFKEYWND